MSRDSLNYWYNRWLSRIDEDADESLWNEIEDELDFQETWENISGRLDKIDLASKPPAHKRFYLKELIGIAASIILVLATAKYVNDNTQGISLRSNHAALGPGDQKIKVIPVDTLHKSGPEIYVAGLSAEEPPASQTGPATQSSGSHTIAAANPIPALAPQAPNRLITLHPEIIKSQQTAHSVQPGSPATNDYLAHNISDHGRRIVVKDAGLVYGYKNTWLLNHETYNGLHPSKLSNALPTYRQEVGAAATLIFNQANALGIEFFWSSEVGQEYQQYINAAYVDRKINLDYLKLQTFYAWEPGRFSGEVLLGGYYSILKSGKEIRGRDSFNIRQNFTDTDYGLLVGYQLKVNVHPRLILKPGLRFSYNMRNIFAGDVIVPSHLKKTNSFSTGFNVTLSYPF